MSELEKNIANVCVIVPTFNRAQYLGEAIGSILDQTRPPAEVIVVDDGSTDKTSEVAKSYGDRIKYVRKQNGGKPAAVNLALRMAQADYVIIADDDDIMFPSGLEHLLTPLERDSRLDFANGGICYFADVPGRGRVELSRPTITKVDTGHHFEALLLGYSMHLNATLIRRRCYPALGGLDESFRRSEDYEFMLRLARRFKGVNVMERITSLRRHEGERGDAQIRHSARERQLVHFDFDVRSFEMVRRDVPIGAYISKPDETLSEQECFEAWFVRAATMARHGVWQGFREDIRECGRRAKDGNPLVTQDMADKLSKVFSRSDTIEAGLREAGYPGWVIGEFIGALGKGAIRPIVRGFYYAARDAYADGSKWLTLRCIWFAIVTIASGFVANARRRT
jgi:Glycosyl transferase family 2/Glycosyltransferase like family 2